VTAGNRPRFPTLDDVLRIHGEIAARTGGSAGVRDMALLQSALASPQATYGGRFLNAFPWQMAAALLVGLAKNHPFIDGNKRIAAVIALAFLRVNGHPVAISDEDLVDLAMGVAEGRIHKGAAADVLRAHAAK
jgi:death on curing protein